ncbi:hypothetical protein S101395_03710 [Bacillus sonorensis]|uniref:Uncharacterized protein n=1 Tax=Bacillus sonorensis TaxID=119858 RepID=A0ABN5AID2_9BACI|nr:hypothetical protein S101395_03710 [Bacillus sonorensis]
METILEVVRIEQIIREAGEVSIISFVAQKTEQR